VPGHAGTFEDAAGSCAGTDGTGSTVTVALAVGTGAAFEAMATDATLEATALGGRGDIDFLADFEEVRAEFVAELVFARTYEPEFGEVAELVATGRAQVAGLRLVEAAAFLVADLHGGVAVLFGRAKVGHITGANLNGGRATEPSTVIKHLDGTELSAKESFDSHVVTA